MTRGIVVDPVSSTPDAPAQSAQAPAAAAQPTDDGLPGKFKGKSPKEIVDAYTNLESELGRARNELGDTRAEARTWRSLYEEVGTAKRAEQPKPTPVEISSDQLIASPKESVSAIVNELLETRLGPVVKDTQRLAQNVEAQEFIRDFPHYVETGNNPEFQEFVGKSARRRDLAVKALQSNDVKSMRALMEDWEERQTLVSSLTKKPTTEEQEQVSTAPTGVEGARKVATEKSGNSAALPSGKVMYQQDVINTMLKDPARYYSEAYQDELLTAIKERRLK